MDSHDIGLLNAARPVIEDALGDVEAQLYGFRRMPYENRCGAPNCVHGGYLHIGTGFIPGSHLVGSRYRTRDFVRAERLVLPHSVPTTVFAAMESFDGLIHQNAGFDQYPLATPNPTRGSDHVTDACFTSPTGAEWTPETMPTPGPQPRECHGLLKHNGYLYDILGVGYSPGYPVDPQYYFPRHVWRKAPGGAWAQRNADLGFNRRHFASASVGTRAFIFGGANDLQSSAPVNYRTCFNDILYTDDDFLTIQSAGDGPFEKGYGRKALHFKDHIVLTPCATGDGAHSDPVSYTNKVWAVPKALAHDPDEWFEIAPLPVSCNHSAVGVLTVDGVETLGIIGGYGYVNGSYGALGHVYTLTSLTGDWKARIDSDFWVS